MKKIINLSILALSFTLITSSCDQGFDELNTTKTAATSVDPVFVLNQAVIQSSAPGGTLQYDLGIVQQIISSNSGVIAGANFNQVNPVNTPAIWVQYYQNVLRHTSDVLSKTTNITPARPNLIQMARIMQAYAFMIVTDTYGDVPYSEAGRGFTNQIFFPKYDAQSTIYPKIIQELTEASAALDPAARIETSDVLYGGNVAKWKKFGYSLLLRAGMRIAKADANAGKAAANAAIAGGVILTNADNAYIRHDTNFANAVGNTLNSTEAANYYLTKPFVDRLQSTSDPRLPAIAVRYVGATSGPEQTEAKANRTAAAQIGMPMGLDDATAQAAAVTAGIGSRYAFTQVDRTRMASRIAPLFFVTASECNLLLAEAGTATGQGGLGLTTPQSSLLHFNAGITLAMEQLTTYTAASTIAPADIATYVASRATPFAANPVLEINTEYWIASFLNGPETWANFRRSNFPVLADNPYPGRAVTFITRLTYPPSETLANPTNLNAAVGNMGGDKLDIKVWWDK